MQESTVNRPVGRGRASPSKSRRPRIKGEGCYNCSQRRIDCDRTEPTCNKCKIKGIPCQGLGLRIRFNDGIASRGKMAGKQRPLEAISRSLLSVSEQKWGSTSPEIQFAKFTHEVLRDTDEISRLSPNSFCDLPATENTEVTEDADDEESNANTEITLSPNGPVYVHLDHLDGMTRHLLQHFSDRIAPFFTPIDEGFNGYRHLILPLAEQDSLVRKAVLVVSTGHLSSQRAEWSSVSSRLYNDIISNLLKLSQPPSPNQSEASSILTTLVLLFIFEIVNGGQFPVLYRAFKGFLSFQDSGGQPEASQLSTFLRVQTRKIHFYAESLTDEQNGSQYVALKQKEFLEFIQDCLISHPRHQTIISNVQQLIEQACDVYVHRAINDVPLQHTVDVVDSFMKRAKEINTPEGLCETALVWSYFVIGAESSTLEHREFVVKRLEEIYHRSKFANVLKAIEQLKDMWARQTELRWTRLLGGPSQAFIM